MTRPLAVLVGVSAIQQREEDPTRAVEACELMARAVEAAAADAGDRALIERASSIRVPRGSWLYADPGRLVADRVKAPGAKSILAEIGVMQQTLLSDACRAIGEGREEIAIVTGGEAKYREQTARRKGVVLSDTSQSEATPDLVLTPGEPLMHPLELERGLMMPVRAFASIDTAIRHREGKTIDEHERELAELMAGLNRVAQDNPHAWSQAPLTADEARAPTPSNRPLSSPYLKCHASNWSVDQASALILCSEDVARELGIPEQKWVYPLSAAESWHVVPVCQRGDVGRSPGAEVASARALELAGKSIDDIEYIDLYSCFPSPVRIFASALGLPASVPRTVTGGMASAGGPLNNYVLQSSVKMAQLLREHPGKAGLTSCVSGFLNKVAFAVWSAQRPGEGFQYAEVSEEVARIADVREIVADYEGPVVIASYTVVYLNDQPIEVVAVCDLPDGRRTLAVNRDAHVAASVVNEEQCGREVLVGPGGALVFSG